MGTKKLGDPITTRWRKAEDSERPKVLRETINQYISSAIRKWLEAQSVRQSERPKNVDPVLTAAQISKKRDELIHFATPILTRPKPKPPKVDGAETPRSGAGTPNPPQKGETPQPEIKTEGGQGPPEMDVD
ncbi:hypothetical protein BJV78DRAFT_1278764 [Lactifluus subvellereus]|nr:hypothetical protein BJV78DRAFT_1278764 [Lactifluus subvellereus]